MRVWILTVGGFDAVVGQLTPGDGSGRRMDIPVYAYLIDLGHDLLLFDTGCSARLAAHPEEILGDEASSLRPLLDADSHITRQLERLGFGVGDVGVVVNSHLHFDHGGANDCFAGAEFWIQRAEWQATAQHPGHYPDPGYRPPAASAVRWLEGDHDVAPGVRLLYTPGHTPGHQSLWVELEQGPPLLFCGDAVYTAAHFDPDHLGAAVDKAQAAESVRRLIRLAAEGARPFFSHDPDQARREGWRLAPFFYR